ncbi:hypothetical protein [Chthonobacter rhizosphaerae]|uniref:hypothetical protein n=1 Tax=Chthonobacter rhizosphaerae TaxID=2735553 RepID=UPI0015EF0217|nr:hypothetical protein [Chthonobacter rhizosphaerae]
MSGEDVDSSDPKPARRLPRHGLTQKVEKLGHLQPVNDLIAELVRGSERQDLQDIAFRAIELTQRLIRIRARRAEVLDHHYNKPSNFYPRITRELKARIRLGLENDMLDVAAVDAILEPPPPEDWRVRFAIARTAANRELDTLAIYERKTLSARKRLLGQLMLEAGV